jgi:hypothetical protein
MARVRVELDHVAAVVVSRCRHELGERCMERSRTFAPDVTTSLYRHFGTRRQHLRRNVRVAPPTHCRESLQTHRFSRSAGPDDVAVLTKTSTLCVAGLSAENGAAPERFSSPSVWVAPLSRECGQCHQSGQLSAHEPGPASKPPSASKTLPVIRFAIGETQNRMTRAMSSGAPARPSRLAVAAPEMSIPAAVSTSA